MPETLTSSRQPGAAESAAALPTEDDIEEEANSHTYLLKNIRVARCEVARFAYFGLMFGIISFIYSFMRIIKDTYVMVRQEPNCILYIKIFYILPLSFVAVIIINYMLSYRNISRIFSIFCVFFMALFFAFGFVILFEEQVIFDPNRIKDRFNTSTYDARGLSVTKYLLLTISQPLATLIFITAELWGSIMLSYLFLSFLNEGCSRRQHGRFLPSLFIVANISLLISAVVTTCFFNIRGKLNYEQNTMLMAGIFFVEGCLTLILLLCKYILERRVLVAPLFQTPVEQPAAEPNTDEENSAESSQRANSQASAAPKPKGKSTAGFAEGLEIMSQSKFLLAMSATVFFFSVIQNILETVFKNGVKRSAEALGKEKGAYSGKFNNYDQYLTSIIVISLNLSSFSNLMSRTSWFFVAVITPLVACVSCAAILGMGIYNASAEEMSLSWTNKILGGAMPALALENYVGMLCLASMKIFKFTAFDVSKEKISMRIADEHRPRFKSVFDGIFNKFGKSFGAAYGIVVGLLSSKVDVRGMSPVSAFFSVPFIGCWMFAVAYLSRSYNKSVANGENVDIDLVEEDEEEAQEELEHTPDAKEAIIEEQHLHDGTAVK
ncbi:ATP:ADP antiporter, AAA family [Pancytospora philotis]|nr:ATP:ADP antiporter, AAA family [Pancytospora philotis]